MNSQLLIESKRQSSTFQRPILNKKQIENSSVQFSRENEFEFGNSSGNHTFSNISLSPNNLFQQNCPLSFSSPAYCPFGGACHTCPLKVQSKLKIGQPNDKYEQEADRIAEQVIKMPESQIQKKTCSSCNESDEENIMTYSNGTASEFADTKIENEISNSKGRGKGLPPDTLEFMESRFGTDFSNVKIHTDQQSTELNEKLNAQAFTLGNDIYFNSDKFSSNSKSGQQLLAHELVHIIQQINLSSKQFQRRINPEDISNEMEGLPFVVSESFTSGAIQLNSGDIVYIITWNNNLDTVLVQLPASHMHGLTPFDIPKTLIRPNNVSIEGIAPYRTGVGQQARVVESGERQIEEERNLRGGPRPGEIPRLEGLLKTRKWLLNRRLIQESMYNRFDNNIKHWTDYYNLQYKYTGSNALDPNLVKSMLFQESEMGTSGVHLEISPGWEVRSRFNLGQVIDSGPSALLIMMREMQPELITKYHLQNIDTDRIRAQEDFTRLRNASRRTANEQRRLAELQNIAGRSGLNFGEAFIWYYRAPGQMYGFADAVNELFNSVAIGQPRRSFDYDFWIRTAIRWLFEKRPSVNSWNEAIRAYNGSGDAARHYRDAVINRATQATQQYGSFRPER